MRTPSLFPPCRAARGGAYERQGRRGHLAAKRADDGRAGYRPTVHRRYATVRPLTASGDNR